MNGPPSTPVEIVRALSQLTEDLYGLVRFYATAEVEAVKLRCAADEAEARAFLNADGSVESRKKTALLAVAKQEMDAAVAEAVVRTYKAKIRAKETDIDVHRTFGASMRAELSTLGYGAAP